MTEGEVVLFNKILIENDIEEVAEHYWGVGRTEKYAKGLRKALVKSEEDNE